MTHEIARLLASSLIPLYNQKVITVLAGLVKVSRSEGKSGPLKIFPIPYDSASQPIQIDNSSLIPDQSQRAILYFEGNESNVTDYLDTKSKMSTSLRLICWYNAEKYQVEEGSVHLALLNSIMELLPNAKNISGQVQGMKIEATRVYDSAPRLFSQYSYREERGQYLVAPYYALGIDITVTYQLNHACSTQLIITDTSVCC